MDFFFLKYCLWNSECIFHLQHILIQRSCLKCSIPIRTWWLLYWTAPSGPLELREVLIPVPNELVVIKRHNEAQKKYSDEGRAFKQSSCHCALAGKQEAKWVRPVESQTVTQRKGVLWSGTQLKTWKSCHNPGPHVPRLGLHFLGFPPSDDLSLPCRICLSHLIHIY